LAKKKGKSPEQIEIDRLTVLYQDLPPKKFALAQGLIQQAARLKVRLDNLWKDIEENGEYEWFTQSERTDPYQRERPSSKTFTATDKNYQSIMRQLTDLLPKEEAVEVDELDAFNKQYE